MSTLPETFEPSVDVATTVTVPLPLALRRPVELIDAFPAPSTNDHDTFLLLAFIGYTVEVS